MTTRSIGVVIHTKTRDKIFFDGDRQRLERLGRVVWTESPDPLSVEAACGILEGCEIGVGSWGTPNPGSAQLVERCPGLRLWIHAAGSVKGMFGPHLKGRDLRIATCKGAIADNVAAYTVSELVLGLRRALENAADNRKGKASGRPNRKMMSEAVVGVLGASDVGRRTIKLLQAVQARQVLVYDPYLSEKEAAELGVIRADSVTEVCRRSDALTLHVPALPATNKMIGRDQLAVMKDDCVIVNTARGMSIDEPALLDELAKGRFFAFLDVSDPEPAADGSRIRSLANVVYTSHIAGGASRNIGTQVVNDVESYLNGGQPECVVTFDMLDRLA